MRLFRDQLRISLVMMAALIAVLILITNLYYLLIEEQSVLGVSRRG